jgi:hypothetical protein
MIEELISRVFYTRNAAHLAHWQVTGAGSFARHAALNDFYDDVIEQIDTLVEAYQGVYGIVKDAKPIATDYPDILGLLTADVRWVKTNASGITKDVSALENLLDNVTEVYLRTIYKLKNLS